ncbi:plasmid pRiA4b ORF-3 family protein [Blautia producta]|uniref:plasmid pRiA4b ORF-3 family protein n=1 Tax=Blautia producta TaxID=33035 RepID=UPI003568B13B
MEKNKKSAKANILNMQEVQAAAERLAEDYIQFLNYMSNNTVKLTARTLRLGKKDCSEINSLFHCAPEIWQGAGRTQEYYVEIDYFFYFSIYYGIIRPFKKGGSILVEMTGKKEQFLKMSSTQRYGIMLTYMFGEYLCSESSDCCTYDFSHALIQDEFMPVDYSQITDMRNFKYLYLTFPRLFSAFGLLEIKWVDTLEKDDKNGMQHIRLTNLGSDIFRFIRIRDLLSVGDEERTVYLLNKFTALDSTVDDVKAFMQPETISNHVTYILKVELGSCMRKIRLGGRATLEELHEAIQRAVNFDNDHMYCFTIGFGRTKKSYYHPYCEDEPYLANEVYLQEILLYEKMKFEYLFDFGDCWRFEITVEKILPEYTENAGVIEQKGRNPKQY